MWLSPFFTNALLQDIGDTSSLTWSARWGRWRFCA